jgi:imidazole glycerol-phosphate synthase subunit HisH
MITIVDYKAGNLTSVQRGLAAVGVASTITADPGIVRRAERIIFPGVGHAGAAMAVLRERGLDPALREAYQRGTPILGICLGCQIILAHSEEGDTSGLGLLEGDCMRFQPNDPALKVPHMGWNAVSVTRPHPLLAHLQPGDEFYFVHSYYPQPKDIEAVHAICEHGLVFPAAIGKDNLFAVQFHAEKSGPLGLQILRNFAEWKPC